MHPSSNLSSRADIRHWPSQSSTCVRACARTRSLCQLGSRNFGCRLKLLSPHKACTRHTCCQASSQVRNPCQCEAAPSPRMSPANACRTQKTIQSTLNKSLLQTRLTRLRHEQTHLSMWHHQITRQSPTPTVIFLRRV